MNDATAVLRELVALKDLRDEYTRRKARYHYKFGKDPQFNAVTDAMHAEHKRRYPIAMSAARNLLARIDGRS
jgi:hypothetical protein